MNSVTGITLRVVITLVASNSGGCVASEDLSDEQIKTALTNHYPEYNKVVRLGDRSEASSDSVEGLSDAVVIGDFNSDNLTDFAVTISRPLREDEASRLSAIHRDTIKTVAKAVVCDRQSEAVFQCYELVDDSLGGIHADLSFLDWESYLSTIIESDQPFCYAKIRSTIGTKLLSLIQPNGLCDILFYPRDGGGYDRCMFCAD